MFQAIDQANASNPTVFTWREREDLITLADMDGLSVAIIDDVAYVGFSPNLASWTVARVSKAFRVARIADGVGRRCDGWRVAVKSIEDAVTRIVADSEIEGWDR